MGSQKVCMSEGDYETLLGQYDSYIRSISGKLIPNDPEDLEQELRIFLWQLPLGKPRSWYIEALKNKAINFLKAKGTQWGLRERKMIVSLDEMEEMGFQFDRDGKAYSPVKEISGIE